MLSNLWTANHRAQREMELRLLRLALAVTRINLRNLSPGINTSASNYMKTLEHQNALTDRVTDVILEMHGTDIVRIRNVLHDFGNVVVSGAKLQGRGNC